MCDVRIYISRPLFRQTVLYKKRKPFILCLERTVWGLPNGLGLEDILCIIPTTDGLCVRKSSSFPTNRSLKNAPTIHMYSVYGRFRVYRTGWEGGFCAYFGGFFIK